ncbi:MAG: ribose 5-phosphate isomerase B [Verrucomicrobia bacterium GWF2_51_19]|nr:MAG: ribose 5-phosphate isomerase B [Verrucomicrobia bacterium GWF2_51_19]HCJ12212.1 ribose 5-phosphate isomerase B [Opitutae bacterium]
MKISIGSDHGAFELKQHLIEHLSQHATVLDRGTYSKESVDYPDFAHKVAEDVVSGKADRGILICQTGIGMSIAANKVNGVRAALVTNADAAAFCRLHNDANVLCLGAKYTSPTDALAWAQTFLTTEFEGGRHIRRVQKFEK